MSGLLTLDGNILLWIQDFVRHDFLTPIMTFITHLGDSGIIWIVLTVLLLCFKKTRTAGILSAVALVSALLVDNIILKNLVARTRPYEAVAGLQRIIEIQKDYSFPSGHAGSSFAAAGIMLCMLPRKWGIMAIVLASLIALSRLYVGVHYPSDVLSGVGIGLVISLCIYHIYSKKQKNYA